MLPEGVLEGVPAALSGPAAMLGLWLIRTGWPRRVGWSVHCSCCGYERDDRGPMISVCPECGGPWRWLGRFRIGHLVSDVRALGAGAALCVLAAAAVAAG